MVKKLRTETSAAASVLVFGIPRGGKVPVGARFNAADAEVAGWIAHHQGLKILHATAAPAVELAALLRDWQLRANRSVLLPVVSISVFENLRALAADTAASPAAVEERGNWVHNARNTPERLAMTEPVWSAMAVRDVVLTPEYNRRGAIEGWWEAAILAIADDVYTVCWLDDPETGFRKRKRHELAPLHPSR
jgi:hypothetical protein